MLCGVVWCGTMQQDGAVQDVEQDGAGCGVVWCGLAGHGVVWLSRCICSKLTDQVVFTWNEGV